MFRVVWIESEIIKLYVEDELSTQQIADITGFSRSGIGKKLKRNNIILRPKGAQLGHKVSNKTKIKIGLGNKNKIHTEESKFQMALIKRQCKEPKRYMLRGRLAFKQMGKTVYQHRYIWNKYNGDIPQNGVIHHINGNPIDNNINNLKLMTRSEHSKLHCDQGDMKW